MRNVWGRPRDSAFRLPALLPCGMAGQMIAMPSWQRAPINRALRPEMSATSSSLASSVPANPQPYMASASCITSTVFPHHTKRGTGLEIGYHHINMTIPLQFVSLNLEQFQVRTLENLCSQKINNCYKIDLLSLIPFNTAIMNRAPTTKVSYYCTAAYEGKEVSKIAGSKWVNDAVLFWERKPLSSFCLSSSSPSSLRSEISSLIKLRETKKAFHSTPIHSSIYGLSGPRKTRVPTITWGCREKRLVRSESLGIVRTWSTASFSSRPGVSMSGKFTTGPNTCKETA